MLVSIGGHHLRIADLGRGTPLLMHDGWVASWDLWLPLIEELQHEWRCIAYDHRGAGASTFPTDAITAPALVDDVFRVLDAAGVERCVVAGESMGCLVVEQAVLRDPSRFLGLVLVGGPVQAELRPERHDEMAGTAAMIRKDWAAYVDGFVSACLPEPDAAPLHRWGVQTLLPAGPEAGIAMLESGSLDAFAGDKIKLIGLAAQGKDPQALALLPEDLSYEPLAFALPRDDSAFRLEVDRALSRIYASGEIERIFDRWLGRLGRPSGLLAALYLLHVIPE